MDPKFTKGEIQPRFYGRGDHFTIGDPVPALIIGGYAVHKFGSSYRVSDVETGYSIGQRVKLNKTQAKQLAMLYYAAMPKIKDKRNAIPVLAPIYKAFCESINHGGC